MGQDDLTISTVGRSALGAYIRSALLARTETATAAAEPYGQVAVEFLLDGTRYRVLDKQRLYAQCYYFSTVAPQTWVLRYTIGADEDYKWKTQAELDATTMYSSAALQLYNTTAATPTPALTRVSDKVVECDVTPQVSGQHGIANPDAVILALNSRLYIVRENGDAITATEAPRKGDFVLGVNGHTHFAMTTGSGASNSNLLASGGVGVATYEQLVEGTTATVASGYDPNDVVGIQYEVPIEALPAFFTDLLVDFGSGFAALSGHEVVLTYDTDNYSFPGRTKDAIALFTDVDGTDASMVTGLVADAATRGALDGLQLGDALILNEGDAVRLRFAPGFTPPNASEISDPSANLSAVTEPERPNPYAAPYDADIGYGWVWGTPRTLTVRGNEGQVLATIPDLESVIPAFDGSGNFVQVGSSPDVYAALFESGGLASLSRIIFRVFDDTLATTDQIFVDVSRSDIEV